MSDVTAYFGVAMTVFIVLLLAAGAGLALLVMWLWRLFFG